MSTRVMLILSVTIALAVFLCGCSVFTGWFKDDSPAEAVSERQALLARIRTAEGERQARQRVVEYCQWVMKDPNERAGLFNYDLIVVEGIRANDSLRNPEATRAYFSDLSNVWPGHCGTQEVSKTIGRIRDMRAMALACDKATLARELAARAAYLAKVRNGMDKTGLCGDGLRPY